MFKHIKEAIKLDIRFFVFFGQVQALGRSSKFKRHAKRAPSQTQQSRQVGQDMERAKASARGIESFLRPLAMPCGEAGTNRAAALGPWGRCRRSRNRANRMHMIWKDFCLSAKDVKWKPPKPFVFEPALKMVPSKANLHCL